MSSLLFFISDLLVSPSESLKTLWTGSHPFFSQILAITQPLSSDKLATMCWLFSRQENQNKCYVTSCPCWPSTWGCREQGDVPHVIWQGGDWSIVSAQLLSHVCSFWRHGLYPARLPCPWNSPGKNAGVDCNFLLQGIFLTQGSNSCLLCLLHWQVASLPLSHLGRLEIS